jgi:hypothetical protein
LQQSLYFLRNIDVEVIDIGCDSYDEALECAREMREESCRFDDYEEKGNPPLWDSAEKE